MKTATVWIDPDTRMIGVRTPYDPGIVSSLKVMIPSSLRRWDGARKIWLIDQSMMAKLEEILAKLGYSVEDGTLPPERATPSDKSPFHDLLCDVPFGTLQKVYRVLAMECHPDRGGNPEVMARINVAWRQIQEVRK